MTPIPKQDRAAIARTATNDMKAVRIIERINVDGRVEYEIQQRHFLFRWWWVPASVNSIYDPTDSFSTLAEAKANLCYFDGSKPAEQVVYP